MVFGIEGDFDWSGINSSGSNTFCNLSGNCQTGNTWLGTARGRIGVAADRVLLYGTGGGVFGNVQTTGTGVTETTTKAGWTAGVGVEVAFTENLTAKIEYLYANLGNGTCTTACWLTGHSDLRWPDRQLDTPDKLQIRRRSVKDLLQPQYADKRSPGVLHGALCAPREVFTAPWLETAAGAARWSRHSRPARLRTDRKPRSVPRPE